jgi:hypothetical protein
MNFDAEITRAERVAADVDSAAAAAVWKSAADVLRERVYRTKGGVVRVRADWSAVNHEQPSARVPLDVIDEREQRDERDLPAFVELFFHDVFLMMNIAAPGSFGGVFAPSGGRFRIRELALDARVFDYAHAAGAKATVPLANVVAWYNGLEHGTRQIAESSAAKVLFHLLHIARGESEAMILVRLAQCIELLNGSAPRVLALRDAIVTGTAPLVHPMHDETLDERLEDEVFEWTEAIDRAAVLVVTAIQQRAQRR